MKKADQFGYPLCQSDLMGVQCDGHEGHGVQHFQQIDSKIVTWFDSQQDFESSLNGLCIQ